METVIQLIRELDFCFVEISGGSQDKRAKKAPWRMGKEDFYYREAFEELKKLNLHKK